MEWWLTVIAGPVAGVICGGVLWQIIKTESVLVQAVLGVVAFLGFVAVPIGVVREVADKAGTNHGPLCIGIFTILLTVTAMPVERALSKRSMKAQPNRQRGGEA